MILLQMRGLKIMNKEDLYRKFECEIQKLYTPNRNMRTYNNLTTEQYKNLEFAKFYNSNLQNFI